MLSYQLRQQGCSVLVIDAPNAQSASMAASGLINPTTGKRFVKSWMIDELLPVALNSYRALERELNTSLLHPISILDFHADAATRDAFNTRSESNEYMQVYAGAEQENFTYHHGIGELSGCWLIDLQTLLLQYREYLRSQNALLEEAFNGDELIINDTNITYKSITAKKLIYCNGAMGADNPYFNHLPYRLNKGEVLIADIPGLSRDYIYKKGIKILPWRDGKWWVGASFEWVYDDVDTTPTFRQYAEAQLKDWLKLPYTVHEQLAALRPSTTDYRPFIGLHPAHKSVGIFNGMGTKGCSVAPYFAKEFAVHLLQGTPLHAEVDIQRYASLLS